MQICGNKLKNFNQTSYKNNNNLDNNNNNKKYLNKNIKEKNEEKNNNINKPVYNVVNRMPKYKIINNKEEINNDTKAKINMNKKYNVTIHKDKNSNNNNTKKEYSDYNNNNNKKISQLLHINLNPKLTNNNNSNSNSNNTPMASLFVNKKNEDFFSSTTYINRTNAKKRKYETKTVNFAKSIDNTINKSIKSNNLNNDLFSKQENDSNGYKNKKYEKKDYFYLSDSNDLQESIFSNTLTSSLRGTKQTLLNIRKEKDKKNEKEIDKSDINNNNKILLTDYTLSGDENGNENNINIIDGDLNDEVGTFNRKYNTKTTRSQASNKQNKIQVKKNKYEYDYYNIDKSEEKYKNNKTIQDLAIYKGYLNKKSDYRNFEDNNDEYSNPISQRKYYWYSKKKRKMEDENNFVQQYKKNPSTIVINNNININFGNKTKTNLLKEKKIYKNMVKNSQIQINNNKGPNSIASLLHKIPIKYNNHDANINVRKNNFININNK